MGYKIDNNGEVKTTVILKEVGKIYRLNLYCNACGNQCVHTIDIGGAPGKSGRVDLCPDCLRELADMVDNYKKPVRPRAFVLKDEYGGVQAEGVVFSGDKTVVLKEPYLDYAKPMNLKKLYAYMESEELEIVWLGEDDDLS